MIESRKEELQRLIADIKEELHTHKQIEDGHRRLLKEELVELVLIYEELE